MSEWLVLVGTITVALSGVPGLVVRRASMGGQWMTTSMAVLGALLGLGGVVSYWATGSGQPLSVPWSIVGESDVGFDLSVDGVSAIFLLPIFLVSLLGSVY